ncbi:MAG TPA: hypothetical protein VF462_00190 [Micromonosporaceae bacterium]
MTDQVAAPYSQGPGAYPPQAGGSTYPPSSSGGMGPAPKQPSKGKGVIKRLIGALAVFLIVTVGGLAWKYFNDDPATAKVGSCLIDGPADDMKTVDCAEAKAVHKVVGKIDGKTEAQLNAGGNPCTAYPTAEIALWGGEKGRKGYILCLEPVKK